MEYEKLKDLNKDFADESQKMTDDFVDLFQKWFKKSPRMTTVMAVHLPINLIINLINSSNEMMPKIFPELPDMLKRFLMPFIILKDEWGKISCEKFINEYTRIYESQFDEFFVDEIKKKEFKKFYKGKENAMD